MYFPIKIKGKRVQCMYDTGASTSIISLEAVKRLKLETEVRSSEAPVLSGAFEGQTRRSYGELEVHIFIKKRLYTVTFIVADLANNTEVIMGQDFWTTHDVNYDTTQGEVKLWLNGDLIYSALKPNLNRGQMQVNNIRPGTSDVKVAVMRTHYLPAEAETILKVILPDKAPEKGKVMIEQLDCNRVHFVDQIATVRVAQWPDAHDPNGCAGQKPTCSGCRPYKFAYIRAKNVTGVGMKVKPNTPVGLASGCTKINKKELARAVRDQHIVNSINIAEPDYKEEKRIAKILTLLGGKYPDALHQKAYLESLMTRFPQTIHLEGECLSVTDTIMHHIAYDGAPIWRRQRPIQREKLLGLQRTVDELIELGSIGTTDSDYNSQVVPVWKHPSDDKDTPREIRLCVDLSPLNHLTPRDRVSVPTWDEHTARLHGSKVFSKIDLKSSFHQIKLDAESQKKTAFSIGPHRYMYRTMPQGLSNSPASLIRLMAMVLAECDEFVLSYMDDFVVHSPDEETHKKHLTKVFECLARAKLQISMGKSRFFVKSVHFLGFVLSENAVRPDPDKIKPLLAEDKTPETLTHVRSIMGKYNQYRRYIPNYAHITAPIVKLTKNQPVKKGKGIKIQWDEDAQLALKKLKKATAEHAVLTFPNFSEPFFLYADASDTAVGGVVMQKDAPDAEHMRPISFYSKLLTNSEKNWPTIEREAYAIFSLLETNKSWLMGQQLHIFSDHKPLRYIFTSDNDAGRLSRWRIRLQEYNPTMHYIPGEENHIADYMSRYALDCPTKQGYVWQNKFVSATKFSTLPKGIPETFSPPYCNITEANKNTIRELKGPLVVLCSTHSIHPTGPMSVIASEISYVKDYFKNRIAEKKGSPWCTEETADSLGKVKELADPNKSGPTVYLCFNTYHGAFVKSDAEQIMKLRDWASPTLAATMLKHNASERIFYAQITFEHLMEKWEKYPPASKAHIIVHNRATDKGSERLARLFRQLAYALSESNVVPHLYGGRGFSPRENSGSLSEMPDPNWQPIAHLVKCLKETKFPWDDPKCIELQETDELAQALIRKVKGEAYSKDMELLKEKGIKDSHVFRIIKGLLYLEEKDKKAISGLKLRLMIPHKLRYQALAYAHVMISAHLAIEKTMAATKRMFYWPELEPDVIKYCSHCRVCLMSKPAGRDKVPRGTTFLPLYPFDCLVIDLMTPGAPTTRGHKHVLVAVDVVSRYAWFLPVRSRKAKHISDILHKFIFNHWGQPKYLHSDNAGEFSSDYFVKMCAELGIRQHRGTPYNPRSQSVCERLNLTLINMLRAVFLEWQTQWDAALPYCQAAYNNALHSALDSTPHFLMFGRDSNTSYETIFPNDPYDDTDSSQRAKVMAKNLEIARSAILNTQRVRQSRQNQGKHITVDVADIVYAQLHHVGKKDYKLLPKYFGPLRVYGLSGNTALIKHFWTNKYYRVSLSHVKLVPHAALTKKDNDSVSEPYPLNDQAELPEIKGLITRVSRHEHITSQEIADKQLPRKSIKVLPNNQNDFDRYDLGDRFEDTELGVQLPKNLEGRTELIGQKGARRKKDAIQRKVVSSNPIEKRIILVEDPPVASRTRGSKKT